MPLEHCLRAAIADSQSTTLAQSRLTPIHHDFSINPDRAARERVADFVLQTVYLQAKSPLPESLWLIPGRFLQGFLSHCWLYRHSADAEQPLHAGNLSGSGMTTNWRPKVPLTHRTANKLAESN